MWESSGDPRGVGAGELPGAWKGSGTLWGPAKLLSGWWGSLWPYGASGTPGVTAPFATGRDATRAFATGDFTPSGLVDDVSALSPAEMLTIQSWLSFYSTNYACVGRWLPCVPLWVWLLS